MSLNELIKQAQEKGLINICLLRLRGKAEPVFGLLSIMVKTEPLETDNEDGDWWRDYIWSRRN